MDERNRKLRRHLAHNRARPRSPSACETHATPVTSFGCVLLVEAVRKIGLPSGVVLSGASLNHLRRLVALASAPVTPAQAVPVVGPPPTARARRLTPSEEVAILLAYQAHRTIAELAVEFSVSRQAVSATLRRNGIPLRTPGQLSPGGVEEAAGLYKAGWSLSRLAAKFGISANTVRSRLLNVGVEMRKPQERPNSRYRGGNSAE